MESIGAYFTSHPYILENARALFDRIEFIKANMRKEGLTVSGKPFSFVQVQVSYEELVKIQLAIVHQLNAHELFTTLLEQADGMPADSRLDLLKVYCIGQDTEDKRILLFQALHDRSSIIRDFAFHVLKQLPLNTEELIKIEDLLLNKSGETRKEVITFLLKQSEEQIFTSLNHLLSDRKQLKRLGGLELLQEYHKENKLPRGKLEELCGNIPAKTEKEQTLLKQILVEAPPEYTFENGFGLFTPYQPIHYNTFAEFQIEEDGPPAWEQYAKDYLDGKQPIQDFISYDVQPLLKKLKKLTDLIDQHADDEYSYYSWNNTMAETTLGSDFKPLAEKADYRTNAALDAYPLAGELLQWVEQSHFSLEDWSMYDFYAQLGSVTDYENLQAEARHTIDQLLNVEQINRTAALFSELKYRQMINQIMDLLSLESNKCETETSLHEKARQAMLAQAPDFDPFDLYFGLFTQVLTMIPKDEWRCNIYKERTYYYHRGYSFIDFSLFNKWYGKCSESIEIYRHFIKFTAISEELARRMIDEEKELNRQLYQFSLPRYLEGVHIGMLTKDHLYHAVFAQQIHSDTFVEPEKLTAKYDYAEPLLEVRRKSIARLLEIELIRGDLLTAGTHLVRSIAHLEGMDYFIRILQALQGEKLARNYIYAAETKKEIFSHLLSNCYPAKTDSAQKLREALKGCKVTEEQLIEAMMFNTHWVDLVSEAIDWPGLRAATWYFSAHTADDMSKYSTDQIALYSQINSEDFRDGAFDLDWFQEAYSTLGPERFKLVYQAAKYVSSSSSHRRAQLYADAAIGKLDSEALMNEISDKRNKDKLRCLGLIPMQNENEALERYHFLQNFLKESKQFGAQRRVSEARASQIALENLARNAGAGDITRFQWRMELRELEQVKPFFTPQAIENIEVHLQVNEKNEVQLHVVKDGKRLKSVPAKLKKHSEIEAIQKAQKALTEQYRRSRTAFEEAMELQTKFQVRELQNLLQHPVLAHLVQTLVIATENKLGIVTAEGLELVNGKVVPLSPAAELTIAHPYLLFHAKEWRKWQEKLFAAQIKQPFKQVFRELYLVNNDEKEKDISKRYAGHQIQPSKTVALLKSRGWQASYEDGLRKIYYKHNIVVSLYAMADWYSPSDVEAPTIEGVYFYDRLTSKRLHLQLIPPTLFSEVMRDIDLVISIAHVGGVDPEASHSTIEMRSVIVEELAKLLKLDNVSVKKNHAIIKGQLAEYTVHLGSGIVHQLGGTEIPILAVQSQHRGRIFLPMVDEDPRTAEIMSKILLLSEDNKMKDPIILQRIKQF